jgi:hypothetical protein
MNVAARRGRDAAPLAASRDEQVPPRLGKPPALAQTGCAELSAIGSWTTVSEHRDFLDHR